MADGLEVRAGRRRSREPWLAVGAGVLIVALWFGVPYVMAFGPAPAEPVPAHEAEAVVDAVVDAALRKDFSALCATEAEPVRCTGALNDGAGGLVPAERPAVSGPERVTEPAEGLVFTLTGLDGDNHRYTSHLAVVRDGDGLKTVNAVFWTGGRISSRRR